MADDDAAPPTSNAMKVTQAVHNIQTPRVTIQFCTQCRWNLRAAYFAQELLQTFATTIGEVSLIPATGGVFKINIETIQTTTTATDSAPPLPRDALAAGGEEQEKFGDDGGQKDVLQRTIWDRKVDGGFPEIKELKQRVRDIIDPKRDLGHSDKKHASKEEVESQQGSGQKTNESQGIQIAKMEMEERKSKESS